MQANAEALTLEWEPETPPEKESGVVLIPPNRQTHAMNSTPHLGEAQRPIGRAFRVLTPDGEPLPGADFGDIVTAIIAMRKHGGMGSAVVRVEDGKTMAVLLPVGSTAARVAARGRTVSAKLAQDALDAQESAWPVSAAEDEEP